MASELRVDKIIPTGGVGTDTSNLRHGGGVIQIVEGVYSTQQTITTTSTGSPEAIFDCDITPKFATSKIRVELVMMCSKIPFHTGYVYLFRGSTILRGLDQGGHPASFACRHGNYTPGAGGGTYQRYAENREYYTFLDNPQTTSTITYNVKGSTSSSSYPFYINRAEQYSGNSTDLVKCRCSLTLTEISA